MLTIDPWKTNNGGRLSHPVCRRVAKRRYTPTFTDKTEHAPMLQGRFLDCRHHPRRQVSLGFEHGGPVLLPDLPRQPGDCLLDEIRSEPFEGPDDITGGAIAQESMKALFRPRAK